MIEGILSFLAQKTLRQADEHGGNLLSACISSYLTTGHFIFVTGHNSIGGPADASKLFIFCLFRFP